MRIKGASELISSLDLLQVFKDMKRKLEGEQKVS